MRKIKEDRPSRHINCANYRPISKTQYKKGFIKCSLEGHMPILRDRCEDCKRFMRERIISTKMLKLIQKIGDTSVNREESTNKRESKD